MSSRGVVFGVLFVFILAFVVMLVELFIPVSTKIEMNIDCRKALVDMEVRGGMPSETGTALKERLEKLGLTNVTVAATAAAGQGKELRLTVDADYEHSALTSIFTREDKVIHMLYDKSTLCRRVIN